jgi:hypothetical protein
LKENEESLLRLIYADKGNEGMTFTKLKEMQRLEAIKQNTELFAHQPQGVHGQELPKFSEGENKEYWKFQKANTRYGESAKSENRSSAAMKNSSNRSVILKQSS